MNNARRKLIDAIFGRLEEIKTEIEAIHESESESLENMAPGARASATGEKSEEAVEALNDAATSVGEAIEKLEAAKGEG